MDEDVFRLVELLQLVLHKTGVASPARPVGLAAVMDGVSAQKGAFFDQVDIQIVPGELQGGADSGDSTSDDDNVLFRHETFSFQAVSAPSIPSSYPYPGWIMVRGT